VRSSAVMSRRRVQRLCWVLIAVWLVSGCAAGGSPPGVSADHAGVAAPPEWRPGDVWVYDWSAGAGTGVKTVEVLEVRGINQVAYFLVRIADVDHFYTKDLHWAGSMRDGKIEARMTPPQPWYQWPLEVGRRWAHKGVYEQQGGSFPKDDTFAVVGSETIEVPAGQYRAFKIVRETRDRDFDAYWYVPEIRSHVKWIGRRGDAQFEESLREYRPAPRQVLPTGSLPSAPAMR
jgi:hypothetical protein